MRNVLNADSNSFENYMLYSMFYLQVYSLFQDYQDDNNTALWALLLTNTHKDIVSAYTVGIMMV